MKLRTHVNLIVASSAAVFVVLVAWLEFDVTKRSVRAEISGANVVATRLLSSVVSMYQHSDEQSLRGFLEQLGRVRAHEIRLLGADGRELYHSPPSPYKPGREAPQWFSALLLPATPVRVFEMDSGAQLIVAANPSRAILDGWDDMVQLMLFGLACFVVLNALVFWLVGRAVAPLPVIASGLARVEEGDLTYRLPVLGGYEANLIGAAFNRMAAALQEKLLSERQARDAEERLQQRRELDQLIEQRLDEERRLIARELHDEFAQSVTAIRSLAVVIAKQHAEDSSTNEVAQLISTEAARLYDAMHGLIPRLAPLALDTLGLAETLEGFIKEWQRRHPAIAFSLRQQLSAELGTRITLAIYRVVQEGVINAVRHAQPSAIEVEVTADATQVRVCIADDGVGLQQDWSRAGHFGLRGLRERVTALGGELVLQPREPRGVELIAAIAMQQEVA